MSRLGCSSCRLLVTTSTQGDIFSAFGLVRGTRLVKGFFELVIKAHLVLMDFYDTITFMILLCCHVTSKF